MSVFAPDTVDNNFEELYFQELNHFNYKIIFDPGSALNSFRKNKNPFHWIRITNA